MGSQSVTPATVGTFTYTLTCDDIPGATSQSASTDVVVTYPASVITFASSANAVTPGQGITLTWFVTGATSCSAGGAWLGAVVTDGCVILTPGDIGMRIYTLTCFGLGGQAVVSATVSVTTAAPADTGGSGSGAAGGDILLGLGLLGWRQWGRRRARADAAQGA